MNHGKKLVLQEGSVLVTVCVDVLNVNFTLIGNTENKTENCLGLFIDNGCSEKQL